MTPASAFEPILERLTADTAAFFGLDGVRLTTVERHERPYSFVARMGVHRPGETAPFTYLYVKAVKVAGGDKERDRMCARVAHEFAVTKLVFDAMHRQPDVDVARPVACYPEHLVIATEQVSGVTMLDYVMGHASWFGRVDSRELATVMTNTGRWLRAFQSFDPGSGTVTLEWFSDYVDIRLRRLVARTGGRFREPDRQRTLAHINRLWPQIGADHLTEVAIHADLALTNVLVAGGRRIVVLDFAMAKRGGPLHDLTRLYVQIEMLGMKPYLRRTVLRQAQAALLAGFDPALTRDSPAVRLYALLHRINHYGSLVLKPESFPTSWYNALVARQHRRWLDAELIG